MNDLPGVHPSPNIQSDPEVFEIENRATDPEGHLLAAMATIAPWDGKVVLDLGAGDGFYIPHFHTRAAHVIAVEPHGPSRMRAMARVARLGLERVSVMTGSAERLFLPSASIDICHARFAYFGAPHCTPGLMELERVMRPGGTAFIIDNDLRQGTFAKWLRRHPAHQATDAALVEKYWAEQGFTRTPIASEWRFATRADLEAVVSLEFGDSLGKQLLSEYEGTSVDYHFCLYHRQYV